MATGFSTAAEFLHNSHSYMTTNNVHSKIPTGSQELDSLLHGGVTKGSVTEIFGKTGSGKTHLCHSLAVSCQVSHPPEKCLFIGSTFTDTSSLTFNPELLLHIAKKRGLQQSSKILDNISYAKASDHDNQIQLLEQAAALMADSKHAMLIIDSAIPKETIDLGLDPFSLYDENQERSKLLKILQKLASEFNIAVVITTINETVVNDYTYSSPKFTIRQDETVLNPRTEIYLGQPNESQSLPQEDTVKDIGIINSKLSCSNIRSSSLDHSNSFLERNSSSDISSYMLRKDLALSSLTTFNDRPESYPLWKTTFKSVVAGLKISKMEEINLLLKYLGQESGAFAKSIMNSSIHDLNGGLSKIWVRLDEMFGAPEQIEHSIKKRLLDFPSISSKNHKALYHLYDLVSEIESLKQNPQYSTLLSYFDSSSGVNSVLTKLDSRLRNKWIEKARSYKVENGSTYPPFSFFVKFIKNLSTTLNDPSFIIDQVDMKKPTNVSTPHVSSRKTEVDYESEPNNFSCPFHNTDSHSLDMCRRFRNLHIVKRKEFLKLHKLCYKCCDASHVFRDCQEEIKCTECGSDKHVAALHVFKNQRVSNSNNVNDPIAINPNDYGGEPNRVEIGNVDPEIVSKCTSLCYDKFKGRSCAKIVPVYVSCKDNSSRIKVYAMIDDQSNRTLIRSQLIDKLNIESDQNPIKYKLTSCSGSNFKVGRQISNLAIHSIDNSNTIDLPVVIECEDIPNDRSEIPTPEIVDYFPHLKEIQNCIMPLDPNADIDILIGRDVLEVHHVIKQIVGEKHQPFAQKMTLGWVIIGDVCLDKCHLPLEVKTFKTSTFPDSRPSLLRNCENCLIVKEISDFECNPKVEIGSDLFVRTPDDDKPGLSVEDKEFLQIMDSNIHKGDSGNWEAPLPFRNPKPKLPNNKSQALHRAKLLDTSLNKNPKKKEHFVEFMSKVFKNGAAEIAPPIDEDKERWYLPLFGVYHPRKPNQIRGVFDSSAIYDGISLNKTLLPGPDLMNNLMGILMRFRKNACAISADIEQMFYCFLVKPDHRDFLRFFWYKNNNPNLELIEYRMRVHVFGNTASPSVAIYGLNKAVENADSDVKQFVNQDFYVDDGLTSKVSPLEAIDLLKRTQSSLKEGGNIRLHKICSNKTDVLNSFPKNDLCNDLQSRDLSEGILPSQRSLGLIWDINNDCFSFSVNRDPKPYTKRGVLSVINSLFDPLGFLAPVVVCGKSLLRKMSFGNFEWDDQLPNETFKQWELWRESLFALESLELPRMYTGSSLDLFGSYQVHIFSDASEKAISAVAYLRAVDEYGTPHVGFITGKSKLAPVTGHTIPRLELCASVLATEIGQIVSDQLNVDKHDIQYYTDSRVVLGYISNNKRRFHTYVCNRVDRIRKHSSPKQWHHVPTHLNPADEGSRFLKAEEVASSMWLNGPPQLLSNQLTTLAEEIRFPLVNPDEDKDIRPNVTVKKTNTSINRNWDWRFSNFSQWESLIRAVVFLKKRIQRFKQFRGLLTELPSVDNTSAELFVIKETQRSFFHDEISKLEENKPIPLTSDLSKLDPFLDDQGILRVGGRLNKSKLPFERRNPILIPKKAHIAILLVRHFHEVKFHQGRLITEGAIRDGGFWILGVKRLVSSVVYKCIFCKKARGKFQFQKMANLPDDRLEITPPFTNVGVDVFGPWAIVSRKTRAGQATAKRWAVIFTCLVTRAVHFEIVDEMSSSAFINALRRFIAIRGNVKLIRSDRGTNFIGAVDDLKFNAVNVEDKPVSDFLSKTGINWLFNPPHSSHMGGVWERLIRIARSILDSMIKKLPSNLTHDVLVTLMAEIGAIMNARPLVPVSTDPESPYVLSPLSLLTLKHDHSVQSFSLDDFNIKDMYKAQWRRVQFLANKFWVRWKNEYVSLLQERQKWFNKMPDLKPGDLVLLEDKSLHRNDWSMGVVEKSLPGNDGLVRKIQVRVFKNDKIGILTRPVTECVLLLSEQ